MNNQDQIAIGSGDRFLQSQGRNYKREKSIGLRIPLSPIVEPASQGLNIPVPKRKQVVCFLADDVSDVLVGEGLEDPYLCTGKPRGLIDPEKGEKKRQEKNKKKQRAKIERSITEIADLF